MTSDPPIWGLNIEHQALAAFQPASRIRRCSSSAFPTNVVAEHEPFEKHTERGKLRLDGRRGCRVLLDVGGYRDGVELVQFQPLALAPREEWTEGLGFLTGEKTVDVSGAMLFR